MKENGNNQEDDLSSIAPRQAAVIVNEEEKEVSMEEFVQGMVDIQPAHLETQDGGNAVLMGDSTNN